VKVRHSVSTGAPAGVDAEILEDGGPVAGDSAGGAPEFDATQARQRRPVLRPSGHQRGLDDTAVEGLPPQPAEGDVVRGQAVQGVGVGSRGEGSFEVAVDDEIRLCRQRARGEQQQEQRRANDARWVPAHFQNLLCGHPPGGSIRPADQPFGSSAVLGSCVAGGPRRGGSEDPWLCGTGFRRLCPFGASTLLAWKARRAQRPRGWSGPPRRVVQRVAGAKRGSSEKKFLSHPAVHRIYREGAGHLRRWSRIPRR
jgi:hypothetical protein